MGIKTFAQNNILKPLAGLFNWTGNTISSNGWVTISGLSGLEISDENKLTISTYYACIRNIAEDVGKIPFRLLAYDGNKRTPIQNDPLVTCFNQWPNPEMTAYSFKTMMLFWALDYGTSFAEIQREGLTNKVARLNPIHPSRVSAKRRPNGVLYYCVRNNDGSETDVEARNMFKFIGMTGNGIVGFEMYRLMMNTLSVALQTQNFANEFFANSARPSGMLVTKQTLDKTKRDNLKEQWSMLYSGSKNAGKTAVLDGDITYQQLTAKVVESDLQNIRQFQKEEIAGWFRMPLYKLQVVKNAQGWSTLDAQESDYVNSCLMPWIKRFEEEVQRQLMGEFDARGVREDYYGKNVFAHLEVKGLLRGDMKSRIEFYKGLFFMGSITPNEIRSLEDMNPMDDPAMDKTYIQGATVPLGMAGMMQAAGVSPTPPEDDDVPEAPETEEQIQARIPERTARLAVATKKNGVHHG
jgi:HK97 family phage portal protein